MNYLADDLYRASLASVTCNLHRIDYCGIFDRGLHVQDPVKCVDCLRPFLLLLYRVCCGVLGRPVLVRTLDKLVADNGENLK